jgi:hypothetical protein
MTAYFVNGTTGSDSNNGLTAETAWASITKAISATGVPLTGGPHTVAIADGTYNGSLVMTRSYATTTTLTGNTANPSAVKVQTNVANTFDFGYIGAATNLHWKSIQFQSLEGGDGSAGNAIMCRISSAAASDITFENCNFVTAARTGTSYVFATQNNPLTRFTVKNCLFDCDAGTNTLALYLVRGSGAGVIDTPVIDGCTFYGGTTQNIYVRESSNAVIQNNTLYSAGTHGIQLGYDESTPLNATTGAILRNNHVRCIGPAVNTHSILIGNGCSDTLLENNILDSFLSTSGYGIVDKGTNTICRRVFVISGGNSGIFFKGSTDCYYENATILQTGSAVTNCCIRSTAGFLKNSSGTKIRNTSCYASPGSVVFSWVGHDNDDDVILTSVKGSIGTSLPSNGYGTPSDSIFPLLPNQPNLLYDLVSGKTSFMLENANLLVL